MGSGERFDSISRIFGSNLSRRKALKLALGGAAGVAGTGAVVALQGGVAGAQCEPGCAAGQQCCTTNVAPNPPFCAPAGTVCCGNMACIPGAQKCCTTAVPNFCAPSVALCCGQFACNPVVSQCCTTGTQPHCEPLGWTCCGDTSCPPGFVCQGYPAPATCVPA